MARKRDFSKLVASVSIKGQYERQLTRVQKLGIKSNCIEAAAGGVMTNLPTAPANAVVVYGDPQSGKTEMMICLTAGLLDAGNKIIVHLMNDSVDLLAQSLDRFKLAGLAPAPRNSSDLTNSGLIPDQPAILFCKKNAKDLGKLIQQLQGAGPVVVIDDEADYATPNAKVNKQLRTQINARVSQLFAADGRYIGVTATPARLNLNNTFNNSPETWVHFPSHENYTGQDHFFPLTGNPKYRLTLLNGPATDEDARAALARFMVTVAHLNTAAITAGKLEQNWSFLVHTSGKTADHTADRKCIETAMNALVARSEPEFSNLLQLIHDNASTLYPSDDPDELTRYIIGNASRSAFIVLNSKRDRATAGVQPTIPTCPFTVIIGGNIVSRGVTFPNLLAMYFTRDVKSKLQQNTYIQRARMFGSRGKYLEHFELTIPTRLYQDWHRCFVLHRLALQSIKDEKKSPVWVGDRRISIAAASSIDRGTVDLNKGEMSFSIFNTSQLAALDKLAAAAPDQIATLEKIHAKIGEALPSYLIKYLKTAVTNKPGTLAIHTSSSIQNYGKSADLAMISRSKGFFGLNQLELTRFPNACHHVKIFHNGKGNGRVFYKNTAGVNFVQNTRN